MVDLISLFYGALATLGTLVLFKIIDMVLDQAFNRTVFGRVWSWVSKNFKKFVTRLKPIRICFQFAVRIETGEPSKMKDNINLVINALSKKHQEHAQISSMSWNDDNNLGSTKVFYNQREFRMEVEIRTEYRDLDPEEQILNYGMSKPLTVSEGIAISLETDFPFHMLEQMLLNLSALTGLIRDELKEMIPVIEFSKGMFTIAPIKGEFTVDEWIKKKRFEVSLLLKAQGNILVNLYPKRAEIIFPTLQIDDRVSEYLRETILNYYL